MVMRHAERKWDIFNFNSINSFGLPKQVIPRAPQLNALRDRIFVGFSTANYPTQHHGLTPPSTRSEKSRLGILHSHLPTTAQEARDFQQPHPHHTHTHGQSAGFMSKCNSMIESSLEVFFQQPKLSLYLLQVHASSCVTRVAINLGDMYMA